MTAPEVTAYTPESPVLAGDCGDTNGKPHIDRTNYLQQTYEFGKRIYSECKELINPCC